MSNYNNQEVIMLPQKKDPLYITGGKEHSKLIARHFLQYLGELYIQPLDGWLKGATECNLKPMEDALKLESFMLGSWDRFELAYRLSASKNTRTRDENLSLFVSRYDNADIKNPFLSSCGKFPVNPLLAYGPDFIDWFNNFNPLDYVQSIEAMPSFEESIKLLGQPAEWGLFVRMI